MISSETFTTDWIESQSKKISRRADPKLFEKVTRAFLLLERLVLNDIDLVFKGGTCLLLMQPTPKRFSIDIDIISQESEDKFFKCFEKIIADGYFVSWKDDSNRKTSPEAPVGHYKFYFKTQTKGKLEEEPLLLDVLFDKNPYQKTQKTPIKHDWLMNEGDYTFVITPTPACILGDKLTAFAPNTTGILYTKNRPVEIIKQLFDIAWLFEISEDLNLIRTTYLKVVETEIEYRRLAVNWRQPLEDAFQTALTISKRDEKDVNFKHLMLGISNIGNFIISNTTFNIDTAIICCGRVAYLCRLLQDENSNKIKRYSKNESLDDLFIQNIEFSKLNKLKKNNPEAFFYWYQATL